MFDEASKKHDEFILQLISARRKDLKELTASGKDFDRYFLDSLIERVDENKDDFTEKHLLLNVGTMLSAGQDTSAQTMLWALWLLAKNPQFQEALHKELDTILADVAIDDDITDGHLSQLKLLDGIVSETLRLKPVAPLNGLECISDMKTKSGVFVPKGTVVSYCTRSVHTNEKYWKDPFAFNPLRWEKDPNPGYYFPFGGGPRICPGRYLAKHEAMILLAKVAQKFSWTLVPGEPEPIEVLAITLTVKGGKLPLRFSLRK